MRHRQIRLVTEHVEELLQGFILMQTRREPGPRQYRDYGIKLHVLNRKRFERAFLERPFGLAGVDPSKVNSIMRPTLPTGSIWLPRTAW